jgi:hypothetical protein
MPHLGHAVVIRHRHARADAQVDITAAAGGGGEALEIGEPVDEIPRSLPFAAQKDALVGDEDVIEQDMGALVHAEGRVITTGQILLDN